MTQVCMRLPKAGARHSRGSSSLHSCSSASSCLPRAPFEMYGLTGWTCRQVRAFEEMESDPNVKPDVACINAMVDALQRLGDMAAAEAYLSQAAQLAQQQGVSRPTRLRSLSCCCWSRLGGCARICSLILLSWQVGTMQPFSSAFESVGNC